MFGALKSGLVASSIFLIIALFLVAFGTAAPVHAEPRTRGIPAPVAAAIAPNAPSSPSPSPSPRMLDRIVTTAERRPTALGATSRETYLINADDLARSGAQTVADALAFVPGVVVQTYGAAGQLQDVMLRGASTEQTLVLLDGRPVNEPDTGVADFSDLPIDGVRQIEIVEGGASMLYGSGAIGGVINIITGAKAHDDAYAQLGYAGAFSSGVTASAQDPHAIGVRASYRHARAQNVFSYPSFSAQPGGVRTNDDTDVQDANATISRTFGALTAYVNLEDNASVAGAPGDLQFGATGLARQQRYVNRSALTIVAPDAHGAWTLDAYADDRRLHFYDATPGAAYDTLTHAATHGWSVRHSGALGRANTLTLGFDSRADRAMFDASYYSGPTVVTDRTAAYFAQDEYRAPASPLTVSGGIRHERSYGTLASTVPSFGVEWRLPNHTFVKANYARAFRAPTLDERYFPFASNPKVEPEYAATSDVGVTKEFQNGVASLTLFGAATNNLIIYEIIDSFGDTEPFNVARSLVRGVNMDAQSQVGSGTRLHVAYTDYIIARDLTMRTRLLYRPTATASADVTRSLGHGEYGVDMTYVGTRFADEANSQKLPAFAAFGIRYMHAVGDRYALTLRADNLFRGQVESHLGYPMNKATLSLRLDAHQ